MFGESRTEEAMICHFPIEGMNSPSLKKLSTRGSSQLCSWRVLCTPHNNMNSFSLTETEQVS